MRTGVWAGMRAGVRAGMSCIRRTFPIHAIPCRTSRSRSDRQKPLPENPLPPLPPYPPPYPPYATAHAAMSTAMSAAAHAASTAMSPTPAAATAAVSQHAGNWTTCHQSGRHETHKDKPEGSNRHDGPRF